MATTSPDPIEERRHSGDGWWIPGGGSLRAFDIPSILGGSEGASLRHHLAHGYLAFLEPEGPHRQRQDRQPTPTTTPALETARKILLRGWAPPLHPSAERRLLESAGLELESENPSELDLTPKLSSASVPPDRAQLLAALAWSRKSVGSRSIRVPPATRQTARLIYGPATATRLGLALIEAIAQKQLDPRAEWNLEIEESLPVASFALPVALELLSAVGGLFGESLVPQRVWLTAGKRTLLYRTQAAGQVSRSRVDSRSLRPHLKIFLEPDQVAEAKMPETEDCPVLVIRAGKPELTTSPTGRSTSEFTGVQRSERSDRALRWIAQTLFARRDLGVEQLDAMYRVLAGMDCAVNLPAGRGRSVIFQLLALVQPGRSLIIEPNEAFVRQQTLLLAAHGIDQVEQLVPDPSEDQRAGGGSLLLFATAGDLRSRTVRRRLAALHAEQPVDTVVVDRAESVSEWSSSFEPALSKPREALRALLESKHQLKFLALAAGEGRESLRDVLAEITDRQDPDVVVEARNSPNRALVKVIRSNPKRALHTLSKHLSTLPKQFGMPAARFYANSPEGRQGVILCARAEGPYGLVAVCQAVQDAIPDARATIFAAETPSDLEGTDFETTRERALEDFTAGRLPLLVTTNDLWPLADAARLDYVVHFGMPVSAAPLQETAGRLAGRDGQQLPVLIHLPQSEQRITDLASPDVDLARVRNDLGEGGSTLAESADLLCQLRRHIEWFVGVEEEVAEVVAILDHPQFDAAAPEVTIPLSADTASPDRALFRLQAIGVLRDWDLSDDGTLTLYPGGASSGDAESMFWERALRIIPARVGTRGLDWVDTHDPTTRESIGDRCSAYLQLVYEAIEPHRRQRIGTLQALSKRAGRREIPSLSEPLAGELTRRLEATADTGVRGIRHSVTALSDLMPQQLRELERTAAAPSGRSPETAAAHLRRGVARLLDGKNNRGFRRELTNAFLGMHLEDGEEWASLQRVFSWLMPRVKAWQPSWSVDLWTAWEEAETAIEARRKPREWPTHILRQTEIHSLTEQSQTPDEAVVVLERRLREACSILDALKEHFWMEEAEL